MTTYIFGALPNIHEGDIFANRKALTAAGIHKVLMGGLMGILDKVQLPSYSMVVMWMILT